MKEQANKRWDEMRQTSFLERGADADRCSKLVAGEALVDALVQLDGGVLNVDCANSRQLPNVNASYGKRLIILPPLVTTSIIINYYLFQLHAILDKYY